MYELSSNTCGQNWQSGMLPLRIRAGQEKEKLF